MYRSMMNRRPVLMYARTIVTSLSMFWPEHHTRGIPVVRRKRSTNRSSRSASVGEVPNNSANRCAFHQQNIDAFRRVLDKSLQ